MKTIKLSFGEVDYIYNFMESTPVVAENGWYEAFTHQTCFKFDTGDVRAVFELMLDDCDAEQMKKDMKAELESLCDYLRKLVLVGKFEKSHYKVDNLEIASGIYGKLMEV